MLIEETVAVVPPRSRFSEMTPRRVVLVATGPICGVLTRLLRSGGYLVVAAAEPGEMREALRESLVRRDTTGAADFTILDTRGANGHASLEILADLPTETRRAVFAIASATDDLARGRAAGLGASIVLAPFDPAELLDAILDIAPPYEIGLDLESAG